MHFLDQPPRFLFFTGKGGVGKTSLACATALLWLGRIEPALWWTAVAGAGAIYTMRGVDSDRVQIKAWRAGD